MKLLLIVVALNVLPVRAQINQLVPISGLDAARSKVKQFHSHFVDCIATNTPAFEQYAVNFMLNQANQTRQKWKLDIPRPLTINDILFELKATPFGIDGSIGTRDGRFSWSFMRSWLTQFKDRDYRPISFRYKDDESIRLTKIKSKIDAKEAEKIARDALYQLGYTDKGLGLINPAIVNQYKFGETNGVDYPLPMFNITWHVEGYDDFRPGSVKCLLLDVSGITERVTEYMNFDPHAMLALPLPPNYFEMLNLPTNYLETAPAHQRELWGLPPLPSNPGK